MSSYQSVREQLIALQVDLDDKTKILDVLEHKVQAERALLGRVEADFAEEYQATIDSEVRTHQAEMERLRDLLGGLISEKKDLMEVCKTHMEAIKTEEARVLEQSKLRTRETEESLETERRVYRSCHEERLQKYLASKAGEERETTGRALQPELARLQLMHERELSDVETNAKTEERRMREAMQARIEQLVQEERDARLEEQRGTTRSRGDAITAELDAAEREQRHRVKAFHADLERDLERYVAALAAKTDKERKAGQAELRKAQEACHSRLQESRGRHLAEMSALLKDHAAQLSEMHQDAHQNMAAIERRQRSEAGAGAGAEGGVSKGAGPADDAVSKEAAMQRDKRIQAEIRALQAESVRLERAWKAKAEEERSEIVEARNREEKESTKRQRHLTEQVSDLAVTREAVAQDVHILNEKVLVLSSELLEGRREVEVYENGIAAHRMRLKDMESMHASRARDEEVSSARLLEGARAKQDQLGQAQRSREKLLEQELASLEAVHVGAMEKLDRQVNYDIYCIALPNFSWHF